MAGGLVLHPSLQLSLSFSLYFIGYGSWLYHASSGSDLGGRLDLYGIFVICFGVFWCVAFYGVLGVLSCNRGHDNVNAAFCWIAWFVWCIVGWYGWDTFLWMGDWHSEYFLLIGFMCCMVGSFLFLVLLVWWFKVDSSFFPFVPLSLLSLVGAVCCWVPEEFFGHCIYPFPGGPASFFQLHGMWHAMLAMCILFIYVYVRCLGMGAEVLKTFNMSKMDFLLLREKYVEGDEEMKAMTSLSEGEDHGFELGAPRTNTTGKASKNRALSDDFETDTRRVGWAAHGDDADADVPRFAYPEARNAAHVSAISVSFFNRDTDRSEYV
jgi:hypothetical protein